jgi:hypothetical protein
VRRVEPLHHLAQHVHTGGVGQASELLEVLFGGLRGLALGRRSDQDGALAGDVQFDQLVLDGLAPFAGWLILPADDGKGQPL